MDDFRKQFLNSKANLSAKEVTWNGLKVTIVEPTAGKRAKIRKAAAKIHGQDVEVDQGELEVWSVIYCTHDEKGEKRIFDEADHDMLLELPGSQLDVLARPAMEYMGIGRSEDEAKN